MAKDSRSHWFQERLQKYESQVNIARPPPANVLDYARFLNQHEMRDRAYGMFDRYLALRPDDNAVRFELARLYVSMDAYDDAVAQYSVVLERRPSNVSVALKIADLDCLQQPVGAQLVAPVCMPQSIRRQLRFTTGSKTPTISNTATGSRRC